MRILYVGDIYGERGIDVLKAVLSDVCASEKIDVVIAQGENVSEGRGLLPKDYETLRTLGVDVFTGGNWSLFHAESHELFNDPLTPVIRPANYPEGTPGKGYFMHSSAAGTVAVVSLLATIVGKDADNPKDSPLKIIDNILATPEFVKADAIVVNVHGDYSSEKVIAGYYLDGRVSAVVGDHWHVPTADAMILPAGTAHITDVGMCGTLHSSLGVSFDSVIPRWRDGKATRNQPEMRGPLQFNAVVIDTSSPRGANSIRLIQKVIDRT